MFSPISITCVPTVPPQLGTSGGMDYTHDHHRLLGFAISSTIARRTGFKKQWWLWRREVAPLSANVPVLFDQAEKSSSHSSISSSFNWSIRKRYTPGSSKSSSLGGIGMQVSHISRSFSLSSRKSRSSLSASVSTLASAAASFLPLGQHLPSSLRRASSA